jgi:hypothetical protein
MEPKRGPERPENPCHPDAPKVLLINPPADQKVEPYGDTPGYPRIAIAYLAGYLREGNERTDPSHQGSSQRLPKHRDFRNHDLFDRGPAWRYSQFHLKRRSTKNSFELDQIYPGH